MTVPDSEITRLLSEWSDGDVEALEALMPLVFEELKNLARSYFRDESPGHTLQPTALVNEVYMRLINQQKVKWENRSQFFAFAAMLMRRILVDHAKRRKAAKRGGRAQKLPLDEAVGEPERVDVDLIALDEALEQLATIDARQSRIVEMRFFAGLTYEQIAEVLDLSVATVKRDWRTAKLWLFRELDHA